MTTREEVIAVLRDPMSFPSELKNWIIKYVEANPPSLPSTGMLGYIKPTKVTTGTFSAGPPSDAKDGDVWIASAVDVNGTRWQFQYNASSSSDYKWEFIGGPPSVLVSTTAPASWTVGSFDTFLDTAWTAARSGDFLVTGAWSAISPSGGGTFVERAGVAFDNGSGFDDPTLIAQTSNPSSGSSPFDVSAPPTIVTMKSSNQVALGYRTGATPSSLCFCSLSVIPVRVS